MGFGQGEKNDEPKSSELWLEVKDFDDEASITPLVVKYGIDLANPSRPS